MGKIILTIWVMAVTVVARGQDTTRLSMLFLGDVMQHDSQIADAYDRNTGSYDYHPCFKLIKPYTQSPHPPNHRLRRGADGRELPEEKIKPIANSSPVKSIFAASYRTSAVSIAPVPPVTDPASGNFASPTR